MQQLIILRGLPGSGKTTWARSWVSEDPKKRIRVNRDDIRRMLGPYWMPTREGLVTTIEHNMIRDGLVNLYNVVIDATNFRATIPNYSNMVRAWGMPHPNVEVVVKAFTHIPIETCIAQDLLRPKSEQVGEAVIKQMFNRYLKHNETLVHK